MLELKTNVSVQIGEKKYEITFPTVAQIMSIESKKIFLSDDTYREQVRNGTLASNFNLNLIDAVAHFSVLLPDLAKDLDEKNLLNMNALKAKAVIKAYLSDFRPWYDEFIKELYDGLGESKKDDEKLDSEE